ncbi:MAG: radical SAM protein, partial [Methanomicrobiales archaeon]|nr:radical SAM protein [Methanomicrobiales archaeon]
NDPGCRPTSALDLAGFLARSTVNGPGTRAVVWVQGCPHRCPGCFNRDFWPFSSHNRVSVNGLAARILATTGISGVTFSGGEPFAQAEPLSTLGSLLRKAGLSVVTYSGYTVDQLAEGHDPAWPALLAVTDLLVAGPYIAERDQPDPLKGSANQQVVFLGNRLAPAHQPQGSDASAGFANIEFTIFPDGAVVTTGFPTSAIRSSMSSSSRRP